METNDKQTLLDIFKTTFIPVQEIYTRIKANQAIIQEKDNYENSLLHYAVVSNKPILVELLIKLGCNPNDLNIYNETPLLFGLNNGCISIEILKLLLKNNISVDDTDKWGRSACFFSSRNIEFLKHLCSHGANINISNENGYTPLMRSSMTESLDHIKYMVEQLNASPDLIDEKGRSALTYSIDSNNDSVSYYLMNVSRPPHNEIQKSSIKRFIKKKMSFYEII